MSGLVPIRNKSKVWAKHGRRKVMHIFGHVLGEARGRQRREMEGYSSVEELMEAERTRRKR